MATTTTMKVLITTFNPTNGTTLASLVPYWSVAGRVLLSLTMIVIMTTAIFGNALVIIVIARNHGMQTRTNFFLLNLAIADFLCGCIDMPFSLITVIRGEWIFNDNVCQMNSFFTPFFFVASIHTLMYIAVFKFLTIHNPFKFAMSRRRIFLMIGAAWTWAAVIGTLSVVGLNKAHFVPYTTQCGPEYDTSDAKAFAYFAILLITCYVIPLCVIAFCNFGMFREIRSHGHRLRETSTVDREKIYAQQKGILVTLLVVVVVFVVTWTPWAVYSLYAILSTNHATHWVNPITFWLGYANSACNPIIYALRSQTFREGYKQIVGKHGPKDAGYKAANRDERGTHIWLSATRTDSSFLKRGSTKEKSKFPYAIPVKRRLSSAGSLPEGFIAGDDNINLEYIPLQTLNCEPHLITEAVIAEPHHHETHLRLQPSVKNRQRESRRNRHQEESRKHQRNLSPPGVVEKETDVPDAIHVHRSKSNRPRKTKNHARSPKPKVPIKEFHGLSANLRQWLISRGLGRQSEKPDVVEVFTDATILKELMFQPSAVFQSHLTSSVVKEYSRSVCSLCSNPECDTKDESLHHRKYSFRHVRKSQCKQAPNRKLDDLKPLFCRYPSVDELDETRPRKHISANGRHQNPFARVEKWYHRHKLGLKSAQDRYDLEQGQPLNRHSPSHFDHIFPGMFRSSSAPCL